jgi:hypothetical protein
MTEKDQRRREECCRDYGHNYKLVNSWNWSEPTGSFRLREHWKARQYSCKVCGHSYTEDEFLGRTYDP